MLLLAYPLLLLKFWYIDAPRRLFGALWQIFIYSLYFFSLPFLLGTYFRPIKNEYRNDLVIFSIIFGVVIKTFLIGVSLVFVAVIVMFEVLTMIVFLLFPIILFILLKSL